VRKCEVEGDYVRGCYQVREGDVFSGGEDGRREGVPVVVLDFHAEGFGALGDFLDFG